VSFPIAIAAVIARTSVWEEKAGSDGCEGKARTRACACRQQGNVTGFLGSSTNTKSAQRGSRRETMSLRAATRVTASAGFTLVEMLCVIAIIVLLIGILVPVIGRARSSARSVQCVSTVRQLAMALHAYADNNRLDLPDPASADKSWEQMLLPYYSAGSLGFVCTSDLELAPSVGSSYDWRDTGHPMTTLAGRLLPDVKRHDAVMVFEALPGWHHKRKINVAFVDGSATTMDDERCFADLVHPIAVNASASAAPAPPNVAGGGN
jgi:prepilin-type N-terminal cleavage/methylation domain-containing protein/prepilin-type processing-associated H-X9-DG protein